MNTAAPLASPLAAPPFIAVRSATGVDAHVVLAGPGARSIAFLIDWVIRISGSFAWFVLANWGVNGAFTLGQPADSETLFYLAVMLPAMAIYFLYHLVLEAAMRGRTPGKRMVGLRILTADGRVPGVGAVLTRNVFRIVDSLPFAYVIGLLFVMFARRHTRLGDLAAGTVVAVDRAPFLERLGSPLTTPFWSERRRYALGLSRRTSGSVAETLAVVDDYRRAAHAVAAARAARANDEHLEATYTDLHDVLHRPALRIGRELLELFRDRVPDAMQAMRGHLAASALLFVIAGVAGMWLIYTYPDLAQLFLDPQHIATVERGELWTDNLLNVVPSAVLSVDILTNNIMVAFTCFCFGLMFGLGTFYIIGLNGVLLGAAFAITAQHGLAGRLFDFVVAHGCVELSCIVIAGAAGAYVGDALIRPRLATRGESFRAAAKQGMYVLAAVTLLLFVCGLIEGYISPDPEIPRWTRVTVGVGYWLFMIAFLRGTVFGRERQVATSLAS